jgi:HD-GYP domain-containing protein (c-di-GMP phosphodiesterase class II)
MNLPDCRTLPANAPFHVNRDFDEATGYQTVSILAIPLKRPEGPCVGVLELINRLGAGGNCVPFPHMEAGGVLSLASMAAVTIYNAMLQEQLREAQLDTIIRLSMAAEYRDDSTVKHIRRVSRVSTLIARAMGLETGQVELLQCASPMHDVGKIGIPDSILNKPGRLMPDERELVERHTLIGAEILGEPTNELIGMARDIALSHHERWDGGGYPRRLAGDAIPLCARIVGVADVFDALVTRRCYKEPYPLDVSLDILRKEDGRHFDPKVSRAFFAALDDVVQFYNMESPVMSRAS